MGANRVIHSLCWQVDMKKGRKKEMIEEKEEGNGEK
jgi:hypothetical protein